MRRVVILSSLQFSLSLTSENLIQGVATYSSGNLMAEKIKYKIDRDTVGERFCQPVSANIYVISMVYMKPASAVSNN